jgi:multisubunit Na+/H+ antiporter MnhB subunit
MAPEPGLALSLGIIFAMAVIVLAITTRIMKVLPPRRSRRAK